MRKMIVLLLILLSIFLTSCKNNTEKAQDMFSVFALNPEETGLVSRVSDIPVNDPNCIEKLMRALCESDGEVYVSAVSKGDSVPEWSFSESDGVLHITEISRLSIDSPPYVLTLRKAAVVKTFSAVSAVKEIRFGSDYPSYSMEKLTSDSLTESVAPDAVREKITVYYSNEIRTDLVPKTYYVNYGAADSMAYVVMNRLIAGPGRDELGYVRTISSDVRINGIVIKNAVCKVDFSKEFLTPPTMIQPWLAMKSIINTLCELDGIQYVTFSVEGADDEFYFGFPLNDLYNAESLKF